MSKDGLYQFVDEFRLIDVNRVFLSDPFYIEIPEPKGYRDIKIELMRDPIHKGGVNLEFGDESSIFGFDHHSQAYSTIKSIYELKGSEARIDFEHYSNVDGSLELLYKGSLVFEDMEELDAVINVRVERQDFNNSLVARFDVEQNIESNEDLDGGELSDYVGKEIALHSKSIQRTSIGDGQSQEILITAPSPGSIVYGEVLLGLDLTKNTVKDYFNYGNQVNANLPDGNFYADASTPFDEIFDNPTNQICYTVTDNLSIAQIKEAGNYTLLGRVVLDYEFFNPSPSGGGEALRMAFYLVTIDNVTGSRSAIYLEEIQRLNGSTNYTENIDFTINESLTLSQSSSIFVFGFVRSTGGGSGVTSGTINTVFKPETYLSLSALTSSNPSLCQGDFIYDVLNRLLKKAIGNNLGYRKLQLQIITGTISQGQTIEGATSGAIGVIESIDGDQYTINVTSGIFQDGEFTFTATGDQFILENDLPDILKSTLLSKTEQGESSDQCGSLDFITNGFAIRNFLNDEYDNDRFYSKGDKVRLSEVDYEYINDTPTQGNTPPNATYWKVQDALFLQSSIQKLIQYVQNRYGAGVAIIKEDGITKVLIEKTETFFQNKRILTLQNVHNVVSRKFNSEFINSAINTGYSIFAKPDEDETILGFNTERNYTTPIIQSDSKLNLIADVCTDGFEIERLRRLTQAEKPEESANTDNDTFIIKCQRFNSTNRFSPALYDDQEDVLSVNFDPVNNIADINGLILNTLIVGDKFVYGTDSGRSITSIVLDFENNRTRLGMSLIAGFVGYDDFHFTDSSDIDKDIFAPERLEGFNSVDNSVDKYSEYNIYHTPTNFLFENFPFYGSGFGFNDGAELIRFNTGKNNIFFEKAFDASDCDPTTDVIAENQNFTFTQLRAYRPAHFTGFLYQFDCQLTIQELLTIKEALRNEAATDINYGFLDFVDRDGVTQEIYPFDILYNPITLKTTITGWVKNN